MSRPSNWPLTEKGRRLLTPGFLADALHQHPLTAGCYPTAMGYYPWARHHAMQRDRHDDNLLILCIEGEGILESRHGRREIRSGDTVLLPRGEAHSYHASAKDPWTVYWVHFLGADADSFIAHLGGDREHSLHSGVEPVLLAGFEQMLDIDRTGYSLDAYIAAANRLRYLLAEFALCRDRQNSQTMGATGLTELQAFMRERVAGTLSLGELAGFTGLTPQHFANRYKAETGYPPMRHFLHMKMEAACRLLDSTDHSVKAVGTALGYVDPLYFSRSFRQIVGLSPSQYRDSLRR